MRSPGLIHVLVSESITHSLEKKLTVRKAAGTLMDRLVRDELLSEAKFMTGCVTRPVWVCDPHGCVCV